MADKNTATGTVDTTAAPENVRVSFTIPKALHERLFEGDRWDLKLEKGAYGAHVFAEYAKNLDGSPVK